MNNSNEAMPSQRTQTTDPYQPRVFYEEPTTSHNAQEYERQHFYQQGYQHDQPERPVFERPSIAYMPPTGQQQQQAMPPQFQGQPQYFIAYPVQSAQPFYGMPFYTHFLNEPGVLARLGGAFCYAGGWVTGLLMLLFAHDNRYIRFHAIQSVGFFGIGMVIFFGLIRMFRWLPHPFGNVFILGFVILCMILAVGWVVGILGALTGKYIKLPFVGHYAESHTPPDPRTTVK